VMVHEEDIEKIAPKTMHEISLLQFCDLEEIDPIYFSRPYFLAPQKNGKRAYALFAAALKKSGKIGIGKMVLRNKQYLTAIRVYEKALCLETLHFNDEVLPAPQVDTGAEDVSAREIETAQKLIESLSEKFHPEKLHDDFRDTILKMLHEKKTVRTEVQKPKKGKSEEGGAEIVDLMAALEASLQQSKKKKAA
jgi:DNA end-binding protein Ku